VLRFGSVLAHTASLDRSAPTGAISSIGSRINASADHNSCRLAPSDSKLVPQPLVFGPEALQLPNRILTR
jgi:hypothetical protein